MTKIIGLTGGIATGKSTADEFFYQHEIPVIDADEVAHHIYDPGKLAWQEIKNEFGEKILNSDQTVNRQALGKLVFSDSEKMKKLNQITHPLILEEIKSRIGSYKKEKCPLIILDVPLLYESHYDKLCDQVIVVSLPKDQQVERLIKRNGLTKKEALKRINSQMPLHEKEKLASYVVENTGTISELHRKLEDILLKIEREG